MAAPCRDPEPQTRVLLPCVVPGVWWHPGSRHGRPHGRVAASHSRLRLCVAEHMTLSFSPACHCWPGARGDFWFIFHCFLMSFKDRPVHLESQASAGFSLRALSPRCLDLVFRSSRSLSPQGPAAPVFPGPRSWRRVLKGIPTPRLRGPAGCMCPAVCVLCAPRVFCGRKEIKLKHWFSHRGTSEGTGLGPTSAVDAGGSRAGRARMWRPGCSPPRSSPRTVSPPAPTCRHCSATLDGGFREAGRRPA